MVDKKLILCLVLTSIFGVVFAKDSLTIKNSKYNSNLSIPSLLHSEIDPYTETSLLNLDIVSYKMRGYDISSQTGCINDVEMLYIEHPENSWLEWNVLNDRITGINDNGYPLMPVAFNFGNIGSAVNIILKPSLYTKQIKIGYTASNSDYNNYIKFTASTGLLKSGWSFVMDISAKWASDGYRMGTPYDSYAYFFGIERKFNKSHTISLIGYGNPTKKGLSSPVVQEIYDVLETPYYNPNWGYQSAYQKRNAFMQNTHQPIIMLIHEYHPVDHKISVKTSLTSTFGKTNTTALSWYNAKNPYPDYYQNLPSFQSDTNFAYILRTNWFNNASTRQIDWNYLYQINYLAKIEGNSSKYISETQCKSHYEFVLNSVINHSITEHISYDGGIELRQYRSHNYKVINDLLGGAYWLDVCNFSDDNYPENISVLENNIEKIGEKINVGDIFGYDYYMDIYKEKAWTMMNFVYKHLDFHLGAELGSTQFRRIGNMKNGRYQDNSYGKSNLKAFFDYGVKGNLTYKITGHHYLMFNAAYLSKAPDIYQSMRSPNICNEFIPGLKNENAGSLDLSYTLTHPIAYLKIGGFYTDIKRNSRIISFYHYDLNSYVNYTMSNIAKRYMGIELATNVNIGKMFSILLTGTFGDYRYTNNPDMYINVENGSIQESVQTVNQKGLHIAGSPEIAGVLALKFHHKGWYANINWNAFGRIYVAHNPARRTEAIMESLQNNTELQNQFMEQEKVKPATTLDFSLGKAWNIKRFVLAAHLGIDNLTNNKRVISNGYEQYIVDDANDVLSMYANQYNYAYGTTFNLGISLSFN